MAIPVIISAGMTKFGEHWDKSISELAVEAVTKAFASIKLSMEETGALYLGCAASGNLIGQEHVAALIAGKLGLRNIPATRIEAACASGGVALREACTAIKAGIHGIILAVGAEKMTDVCASSATAVLGAAGDSNTEAFNGATFPAIYAMLARAHMHKFGTTEEQLAAVSVKNHQNAVHNPHAQFSKPVTVGQVMNSQYVAEPLKVLDCSPISDGAAAVIVTTKEKAEQLGLAAVEIIASEQASDTLALADRSSLTELSATRIAAEKAFSGAGIGPGDIDVAEVHDCFTIAEILAIEDLGFFDKGHGARAVVEGRTVLNGEIAVNTSGGLKAAGHPVGATGIKQAAEIFWQLTGTAGCRQRKGAKHGLTHNIGGSGATCVVHIYRRVD